MRAASLVVLLIGCGPVRLGKEAADFDTPPPDAPRDDAKVAGPQDGGATPDAAPAPLVLVNVQATGFCTDCYEVSAEAVGGIAPYAFEWIDGSREPDRFICARETRDPLLVRASDAVGSVSPWSVIQLEPDDSDCLTPTEPPLLCIRNPSFEGTPRVNAGRQTDFDAEPWSVCTNPSMINTPTIVNNTIAQTVASVPQPSEGLTFIGLVEQQQVSQRLCEALPGGSEVSVQIDLARIHIGGNVVPETELAFLEIWGGVATDCSRRELLWASPPLTTEWQTYCLTLRPTDFMDNLVLLSRSDNSLPTAIAVVADNMVPVSFCP